MAVLIQYKNNVAGVKVNLDKALFCIGRGEASNLCLDDALASREHAVIEQVESRQGRHAVEYVLRDRQSTNGTFVNHARITAHLLVDGDVIRIGQTFFKFVEGDNADLHETKILKKTFIPGVFYTTEKSR